MIFARAFLGQELILVGAIMLALELIYIYLRQRNQLDLLRRVWLPALFWAIFGTLDALVTLVGTWGDPSREGNPTTRAFLSWGGWAGLVLGTFLYVLLWALVVIRLETLRGRLGGVWARVLGGAQLLILYALAAGHFSAFSRGRRTFPSGRCSPGCMRTTAGSLPPRRLGTISISAFSSAPSARRFTSPSSPRSVCSAGCASSTPRQSTRKIEQPLRKLRRHDDCISQVRNILITFLARSAPRDRSLLAARCLHLHRACLRPLRHSDGCGDGRLPRWDDRGSRLTGLPLL